MKNIINYISCAKFLISVSSLKMIAQKYIYYERKGAVDRQFRKIAKAFSVRI